MGMEAREGAVAHSLQRRKRMSQKHVEPSKDSLLKSSPFPPAPAQLDDARHSEVSVLSLSRP